MYKQLVQCNSVSFFKYRRGTRGIVKCCNNKQCNTHRTQLVKPKLEKAIAHAQNICALVGTTIDCMLAWDEVDELTSAFHKLRDNSKDDDPLEKFCEMFPDADECRIYDN